MPWSIGSACSGIGCFDLGLERAGVGRVAWQIEIDGYCRQVLARHWPEVTRYEDVRTAEPAPVDVLCAGFPCQPASVAGKRKGTKDARWLWPAIEKLIRKTAPRVVIIENVPGLRTAGMRDVLADLARLGFDAEWAVLSAGQLGAPHLRKRLFIVATDPIRVHLREQPGWLGRACREGAPEPGRAKGPGRVQPTGKLPADPDRARRLQQALRISEERGWPLKCGWSFDPTARVHDGPSRGMVEHARKALGNAIVVPCVELIGRAIVRALASGPG